jgi:hypothetical protein
VRTFRRISIGLMLALSACSGRDAETDEAAIASDSAAAAAPIVAPPPDSMPSPPAARSPVRPPSAPADKNPSVPRRTPGAGLLVDAPLDTARGVIALVGAEPNVSVQLRGDAGGPVTLVGAPTLASLSGLELWVAGRRSGGVYEVRDFVVRAADGVPALDGILTERAGGLALALTNGDTTPISGAPEAIRPFIGKRVWVTLANGEVQTFGVVGLRP